ncbi:RHS repeat-associated core domain-containing protein [Marivirga tractuosa]|uniref:RHS repeat domain-containing protein n=1 Tax=Marivirga tractuosa TaxID=1006 RepID=UPI0035CF4DC0
MATYLPGLGLESDDRTAGMQAMEYHYDQLNRITHGLSLTNYTEGSGFATRDAETASPYDAQYSYDANGNLLNLQRNNEASEIQDDFDYQYYAGTNKLRALEEGAADAYIYDEIGNLVEDVEEGTTIEWTPYGKVRRVTKAAENLNINYRYDAAGNRVAKMVDKDGEVTTNRYIRDASGNVMAVYQDTLTLEHHIYGSSRLGLALEKSRPGQLKLGHRQYELSNHLGNVLAVITDNVNMVNSTENSEWYESKAWPTLVKTNDYYPFGLAMGGRTSEFSANDSVAYRYGFNGKEKDVDFNNHYDYGFRIYNPRIAKFLSVDPLTKTYPMLTPYQFASNTPIQAIDLDGLEAKITVNSQYNRKRISKLFHPNEKYISSEVGKQAALLIAWYSVDAVYENDDHLKMYPNVEFPKSGKAAEVTYDGSFKGVQIWAKDENDNEVYLGSINNMSEESSFFDFFDMGVGEYKERDADYFDNLIARNVDQNALDDLSEAFGNGFDLKNSLYGEFLNSKGFMIGGGLKNLDSYEGFRSKYDYTGDTGKFQLYNYETKEHEYWLGQ